MKAFDRYNPYIILLHFLFVTGVCMMIMHPIVIITALVSGMMYALSLFGRKAFAKMWAMLPVVIITAAVNPIFNHSGATVLGQLPWGKPFTFEAVVFGLFAGLMLWAAILWFSCFNNNFKSDKIMYVFGKAAPSLALVLSMIMRFVPRLSGRTEEVIRAQQALGRDIKNGPLKNRLRLASGVFSQIAGWGMENSVEVAQGMRCRGFLSGKRTAFSVYTFDRRDVYFLIFMLICAAGCVIGFGSFGYAYYPEVKFSKELTGLVAYGMVCGAPVFITAVEEYKWR